MKQIILDHLRRWWWLWLLGAIVNFFMSGLGVDEKNEGFDPMMVPLLMWLGAFQLNLDLQRGHSRAIVTMPVTARNIGRSWWLTSVALPALMLAATAGLGMFAYTIGTPKPFPTNEFFAKALMDTVWFGVIFFLVIGQSPRRPQTPADYARLVLSLIFYFIIFGEVIWIKKISFQTPEGLACLLVGAALTIAGWFQAGRMATKRAGFRPNVSSLKKISSRYKVPTGFGGLSFLVSSIVNRVMMMVAVIVAVYIVIALVTGFEDHLSLWASLGSFSFETVAPMFILLLPWGMYGLHHLRFLRTMPVSRTALATTLVSLPCGMVLLLGGIATAWEGFFGKGIDAVITLDLVLFCSGMMAIFVAICVWRGLTSRTNPQAILAVVGCAILAVLMCFIFETYKTPVWPVAIISSLLILVGIKLTARMLEISSAAYHASPSLMTDWGGWR